MSPNAFENEPRRSKQQHLAHLVDAAHGERPNLEDQVLDFPLLDRADLCELLGEVDSGLEADPFAPAHAGARGTEVANLRDINRAIHQEGDIPEDPVLGLEP